MHICYYLDIYRYICIIIVISIKNTFGNFYFFISLPTYPHLAGTVRFEETNNILILAWSVCQLLPTFAREVYVSFFLPMPVTCMSASFHLCQWSVYHFLPTCASEVYISFFPLVPVKCVSFFPPVPMKCMSVSFYLYQWSVLVSSHL